MSLIFLEPNITKLAFIDINTFSFILVMRSCLSLLIWLESSTYGIYFILDL